MKLGIVGLGVVGTANQKGFEALGHDVNVTTAASKAILKKKGITRKSVTVC